MEVEHVTHEFKPIYNKESKVLMLGTMPSPKSREVGFYYGHPRNRFWKVLSDVCGEEVPETKKDKITFALRNHIAVWDVLAGCEIRGADDSTNTGNLCNRPKSSTTVQTLLLQRYGH